MTPHIRRFAFPARASRELEACGRLGGQPYTGGLGLPTNQVTYTSTPIKVASR